MVSVGLHCRTCAYGKTHNIYIYMVSVGLAQASPNNQLKHKLTWPKYIHFALHISLLTNYTT